MADLTTDIRYIKGIGEQRAKALGRLGLYTLGVVIGYFPRSYEDRTVVSTIADAPAEENVCIRAMVATEPRLSRIRRGLDLVKLRAVDESGALDIPSAALITLAAFYGTSVDYLLGLTDNPVPYRT